jgi:hypothetical protein
VQGVVEGAVLAWFAALLADQVAGFGVDDEERVAARTDDLEAS